MDDNATGFFVGFGIISIPLILILFGLLVNVYYPDFFKGPYLMKFLTLCKLPFTGLWNLGILIINLFKSLFVNNGPLLGKDNCAILPGSNLPVSRVPSAYLAHVAFFFAFLFTNAYYVYITEKEPNDSTTQYENRRYRSAMIMATIIILYIIIIFARYNITGCDSSLGIVFTTVAFGGLGVGIYKLAEACGARTADILGISSSFVPDSAENSAPLACKG